MAIQCSVRIEHENHCLFQLKTSGCNLRAFQRDGAGKEEPWINNMDLKPINQFAVLFTLDDGQVKSVFHDANDPLFSVNLKRGIISAFVLKKSELEKGEHNKTQIDVQGSCPAEISSTGDNKAILTKDMANCDVPSRKDWRFSPYSMFWNMSFVQYMINSTNECHYVSNGDRLLNVHCSERHAIMLESSNHTTNAVQTNIQYTMKFKDSQSGRKTQATDLSNSVLSGIQYEHEEISAATNNPNNFLNGATKIISDLVHTTELEIRVDTIRLMQDLVDLLRTSSDLTELVEKATECNSYLGSECNEHQKKLGNSYLADALLQCNSVACNKGFAALVEKNVVSKPYLDVVLFSWSNLKEVEHGDLEAIVSICKYTNKRMCWLTFGAVTNKYFHNNNMQKDPNLPSSVKEQLILLANYPKETQCGKKDTKPLEQILTDFKIIGNLGEVAQFYNPDIAADILECAKTKEISALIRVTAIQALRKMKTDSTMSSGLLEVFKGNYPVEVRAATYKLLVSRFHSAQLADELINFLKSDTETQVVTFVASDLKNIVNRPEADSENEHFGHHVKTSLKELDFDLNSVTIDEAKNSFSATFSEYDRLDFLPDKINGFGALLKADQVLNTLSFFPETLTANLTLELFSKTFNLVDFGLHTGGWEGMILKTVAILKTLQNPNPFQYLSLIMQQLSAEPGRGRIQLRPVYLLDKKVEEAIKSLRKLFLDNHEQLKPYLMMYARLFGNDLDVKTLDDVLKNARKTFQRFTSTKPNSMNGKKSYSFNSTHVVKFIEGYHHFPSMMGLVVSWRSDCSLAFSVRTGLNSNLQGQQTGTGNVYVHPSSAANFIGRLIVELPTITKMGVQANTTFYSSYNVDVELTKPANAPFKLSLIAQDKLQRPLEIFRENNYIQNDKLMLLEDYDIQRIEDVKCSSEKFEKVTGMKLCVDRSYADVRDKDNKPWALLAGNAKWRLTGEKSDKGLKSYDMSVQFSNKRKSSTKEATFKFEAPGTTLKRVVPLNVKFDTQTGESNIELSHSDFPEFLFKSSRIRLFNGVEPTGHMADILIKESDAKQYQIHYSKENRREERSEPPTGRNKSPKVQVVIVKERNLKLKTPNNEYQLRAKSHDNNGHVKADLVLSYDNTNHDKNWLSKILPTNYWENDHKAWFEIRGNWHPKTSKGKDSYEKMSTTHLAIPTSTVEIISSCNEQPNLRQHYLNITHTEKDSGKVLTFINMAYNCRNKGDDLNGQDVHSLNLTIPRHSVALDLNCERGEKESNHKIVFTRSKMVPKDESDSYFAGWWSPEHSDRFEHHEDKSVYEQNMKYRDATYSDYKESFKGRGEPLDEDDEEYQKMDKKVADADIKWTYPFDKKTETIEFKGTFRLIKGKSSIPVSFMKDFVLKMSRQKLQLDSSTTLRNSAGDEGHLVHKSFFTNTENGKNQGTYNLEYIRETPDECPHMTHFQHNISAHWLEFSSKTILHCKPGNTKAELLNLDMNAHHPYWQDLDFQLQQSFDFAKPGGESMNFTSNYLDINVAGEWAQNHYHKKAVFTTKNDLFENAVVEVNGDLSKTVECSLEIPRLEITHLKVNRVFSDHEIDFNVKHKHKGASEYHKDLNLNMQLTSPHSIQIKGEIHEGLGPHFKKLMQDKFQNLKDKYRAVINDPNHELNVNLMPYLGKTVGDYMKQLKSEAKERREKEWDILKKGLETFKPFYDPMCQIVKNARKEMSKQCEKFDVNFKTTNIGWAYHYFDIPETLKEMKTEMNLKAWLELIFTEESKDGVHTFHHEFDHPFEWNKLTERPNLSDRATDSTLNSMLHYTKVMSTSYLKPHIAKPLDKVALIFGKRGVMTFDGEIYRVPKYPMPDCGYLLAADSRASTFSVVSRESDIHAIFADLAVTIKGDGSVSFNNSKAAHNLPYESYDGSVKVTHEGRLIRIRSPSIKIDCDIDGYFCVFVLEQWYHSGTMGLLGNANGNKNDDFKGPTGDILENRADFMAAYEVTQQEVCKYIEADSSVIPSEEDVDNCREQLESIVPMKACVEMGHFDLNKFARSCASEVDRKTCYTKKAVVAFCSYYGLEKKKCISCPSTKSESFLKTTHIKAQHKLQVVLLVDQHSSMFQGGKNTAIKGLETLTEGLGELFESNSYSSIAYSLVGFGGKNIHNEPHIHTNLKKTWVLNDDIPNLLKEMKFEGEERENGVKAIEYAINTLEFEPSASKVFVLLTVDDTLSDHATQRLHAVQKLLNDNGITLYTFATFPSIDKGKKVYGVRADGYIFPQSDTDDYMTYPRGNYAKLTSSTRGSLFSKSFLEENVNAEFFNGVYEEIFAKVGKESRTCKSCHCERNHLWNQFLACRQAECK